MDDTSRIARYLAQVRRRQQVVVLARALSGYVSAVALVVLGLVLAAGAGWAPVIPLRVAGLALLAPLTAALALYIGAGLRRLRRPAQLARLVGRRRPLLRSDLLSCVELQRPPAAGGAFSPRLVQALLSRTWRRLRRASPAMLVPARLLRPAAVIVTLSAISWAAVAASLPDALLRGTGRLLSGAPGAGGQVARAPLVGDLKLTYTYPDHMNRKPRTVESSTGHLTAPLGTRVSVEAVLLAPARSVRLVQSLRGREDPLRVELSRRGGARVRGEILVQGEGTYHFRVDRGDGLEVVDPVERRLTVEPDAAPTVTLYGPPDGVEVTRQHRIELGYTAEDDYGLSGLALVYRIERGDARRVGLWRGAAGPTRRSTSGKHEWVLEAIDLEPGALVSYWIEARDNDTISGPKAGRSARRQFRVYSAKRKHAETMRQQEKLLERAIQVLGDRLLLFEKTPPLTPGLRLDKANMVHRAHGVLADGLRDVRNRMRKDELVSRAAMRRIGGMHDEMVAQLRAEAGLLRTLEPARRRRQVKPHRLGLLQQGNRKLVAATEKHVLALSNLLDEQRLQGLMTLMRTIGQARKRLSELLASYRKSRDEGVRRQIMRQIERMQRQVERLMRQASRLRTSIPDEYLNAEALRRHDIAGELRSLSKLAAKGDMRGLEARLARLDSKLAELRSLLSGNLGAFRRGRMSARERAFGAALDRLRGLEDEQRAVARRTRQIIHRYHRRAAKLMKHTINPFVRQQLKKLKRLRARVNDIDARALAPYDQEQLERVKQRVRDLRGMLDQGDLDQALRMSMRMRNALQVLQDDLTEEMEGRRRRQRSRLGRALRRTRAARKLAEEMAAELRAVFPDPRRLLERTDRAQMRRLTRRQRALQRRLQQLSNELAGQKPNHFGQDVARGLGEAGALMGKSAGKLGGLRPKEAHGAQQAAAERLARLQRQLRNARQPSRWSAGRPSVLRERIRIPGAETFKPPRAFRRDILDAMKEKAPRRYRRQVKRYYEELVR